LCNISFERLGKSRGRFMYDVGKKYSISKPPPTTIMKYIMKRSIIIMKM